jgi:hypothetical protein
LRAGGRSRPAIWRAVAPLDCPMMRDRFGGGGSLVRTRLCGRIPCSIGKVQGKRPLSRLR